MAKKLLNLRVTPDTIDRLNITSNTLDIPYSQIIREAINEKLEKLQSESPKLKKALRKPVLV